MAVLLPPSVPQKRQKDSGVQQAFDQVVLPVNTILAFLRSVFTQVGNSVTAVINGLIINGNLVVNGTETVTTLNVTGTETVATLAVTGNETVGGTLAVTGVLTGAGYSGGPISGTAGTYTGAVSAPSFVSAAGFKSILGTYTFVGATTTSVAVMSAGVFPITASNVVSFNTNNFGWVAPFAGSIVGISLQIVNSGNVKTISATALKNGTPVAFVATTPSTAIGAFSTGRNTAAKGAVSFVAGDYLGIGVSSSIASTGTTDSVIAYLVVEMGA